MSVRTLFLSVFLVLLVGCAPQDSPAAPIPIEVEFTVMPDQLKAGEVATLQVVVKQGDELVDDAQEVQFEIWKDGQEKHDTVDAESKGEGVYQMMERFQEPGNYHVMYHVTARDMHNMEENQVVVQAK